MTLAEAVALIRPAVPAGAAVWADLGAGGGLFTHALAQCLGRGARVVAVDQEPHHLRSIPEEVGGVPVRTLIGDLRALAHIDELPNSLDGALLANVLHFIPEASAALAAVADRLRPGGRIVLVEYDRERSNRWVPHPIPRRTLGELAAAAGLAPFEVVGERPSSFGGQIYCAVARVGGS